LLGDDAFNGDFDIDPHLANQLLDALVTSGQCSASDWTHDFADRGYSGDPGTLARLYEEGRNNLVGPGSILGNLNTGLGAAHAAHALSLQRNIDAGAQTVIRRASPSVTINHYVTLYDGNTTGKGKPRPKLRIRNLPIQTVQPALGPHAKHNPRTRTTTAALKGADLKKLTPGISPLRHLYAGSLIGSGVLTFAPSLALDIAASISRDTQGAVRFDSRAFVLASAFTDCAQLVERSGDAERALSLYRYAIDVVGGTPRAHAEAIRGVKRLEGGGNRAQFLTFDARLCLTLGNSRP